MNPINCPKCNRANLDTAVSCLRCGHQFGQTIETGYSATPPQYSQLNLCQPQTYYDPAVNWNYPAAAYHQAYWQNRPIVQSSEAAIGSFVVGLLGLLLCQAVSPIGLGVGIYSLYKAQTFPKEYGGKGYAIAGIILNGIAILIFLLLVIVILTSPANHR